MNQKSIAKQAKVSVATVSRVINNRGSVSEATREKVLEVLKNNAYVIDNNARYLRTAKSKTIGFLVSNFSNPFFISIYEGVEPVCHKQGYNIIIGNTNENIEKESEAIDLFLSYRVAGIIANFVEPQQSTLKKLENYGTCIFVIDRPQDMIRADTILIDNLRGSEQQVDYLADLGHRRIAVVHGLTSDTVGKERLKGYYTAMKRRDLEILPGYVICGKYKEAEAYRATIQIMQLMPRPTALITHNNLMCIGAYKALKDLNIKIPDDVSLIGFDDFNFSDYLEPSISLIDRSLKEMGEVAGQMIIERIEGKFTGEARTVILPFTLKINKSCAPPHTATTTNNS